MTGVPGIRPLKIGRLFFCTKHDFSQTLYPENNNLVIGMLIEKTILCFMKVCNDKNVDCIRDEFKNGRTAVVPPKIGGNKGLFNSILIFHKFYLPKFFCFALLGM